MAGMDQQRLLGGGGQQLDTEVCYGLPIGTRFVGTPRAGVPTSEHGREYQIGYGMQVPWRHAPRRQGPATGEAHCPGQPRRRAHDDQESGGASRSTSGSASFVRNQAKWTKET